ncbi:MAG: nitroreductase family protein [Candidatus Acidiferrales bacterium]
MNHTLEVIFQRRAIKVFDPVEIPRDTREQILNAARVAPSSSNSQPYRFYWLESAEIRGQAAHLCMGQIPARTASVLVVAVADLGSWQSTAQSHLEWMRSAGFSPDKIEEFEHKSKLAKLFFIQGWFGILGALKWSICRLLGIWKIIGTPPVARHGLFKWATKSAALACENMMIAAEALGLNTCPMEGFDARRLSRFLGLSRRDHEIVMVIAIGKKSARYVDQPQWRRPLDATVTIL